MLSILKLQCFNLPFPQRNQTTYALIQLYLLIQNILLSTELDFSPCENPHGNNGKMNSISSQKALMFLKFVVSTSDD